MKKSELKKIIKECIEELSFPKPIKPIGIKKPSFGQQKKNGGKLPLPKIGPIKPIGPKKPSFGKPKGNIGKIPPAIGPIGPPKPRGKHPDWMDGVKNDKIHKPSRSKMDIFKSRQKYGSKPIGR